MTERSAVFIDFSGRRWRRIRRVALVGGVFVVCFARERHDSGIHQSARRQR
jgi:hypothetical protein